MFPSKEDVPESSFIDLICDHLSDCSIGRWIDTLAEDHVVAPSFRNIITYLFKFGSFCLPAPSYCRSAIIRNTFICHIV